MARLTRIACAVTLALAVGAVPVVADWCAISCEAGHGTTAGAPTCHHVSSSGAHLNAVPAPCSHDHHPVVVDRATTVADTACPIGVAAASSLVTVLFEPVSTRFTDQRRRHLAPSAPLDLALASILRV